jgi:hypothetical protein
MFLDPSEVVTLIQVLAVYTDAHQSAGTSDFQRAVDALRRAVENDLSGLGEDPLDVLLKEKPDDEADEDKAPCEDPADEEDETDDAVSGEGDESQDQDAGSDEETAPEDGKRTEGKGDREPDPDFSVRCRKLAKLPKLRTDLGIAEFYVGVSGLGFQVNDHELTVVNIYRIKRSAVSLHLLDGYGEWHIFNVRRFPREWSKLLPTKQLARVV